MNEPASAFQATVKDKGLRQGRTWHRGRDGKEAHCAGVCWQGEEAGALGT